jgi:hypothetical protein
MSQTRGVLFIHSAPSAVCPHIEWAIAAAIGVPVNLDWANQPAQRATQRAEFVWSGPAGTAAKIASTLAGWGSLRFEITEEPCRNSDGQRYSFTPSLGLFSAQTSADGDIVVNENRLRGAVAAAALKGIDAADLIGDLLGTRWDDELEVFRYAGEGAPVRWLTNAV